MAGSRSLGTLTVDLVAKIAGFEQGMDKAERALDKRSREMSRKAKQLGADIGLAISAGLGVAATAMGIYVKNTIEAEKVQAQLAARIKSTGGAAGLALKDLNEMADALQRATTFDDEAIGGAQSLLLTFTKIGKDVFPAATEAVLDMSTAMDQGLKESAVQLGKALNDPIQGVTALTRVGVQFTEAQKEQIKTLVESGRAAEAQRIILGELEKQMGGSARAARDTLGGALEGLKNTVDNLLEGDSGSDGMKGMVTAVNDLNESLSDPELKSGIDSLAEGLLAAANAAVQGAAKLGNFISEYKQFLADRGFIEGKEIEQLEKRRDKLVAFKGTLRGKLLFDGSDIGEEITRIDNRIEELRQKTFPLFITGDAGQIPDSAFRAVVSGNASGGGGTGGQAKAHTDAAKAAREQEAAVRALLEADEDLYAASLRMVDVQSQAMIQWTDLTAHLDGPLKVAEVEHIQRLQEIEEVGRAAGATAEQIAAAKAKETDAYNATTEAIRAQAEALANDDLIRGMDSFRNIAYDFLVDLPREGKDAWRDFLDDLTDMLNRWAANGVIDQLFGKQGTTGQGTAGGGWINSIVGAFAGSGSSQGSIIDLFSGAWGFANGGTMNPYSVARVNERGFEMATVGGDDYLLTGNRPVKITPHERLMGGGNITQQFITNGTETRRTREQKAVISGLEAQRALMRTGR